VTPRQFIFGPFLLGVMAVILGTMIYCSRPSPPPAVVVSPTLVIVAPTSTVYVFASPSPDVFTVPLQVQTPTTRDALVIATMLPTATLTPTSTSTPVPTIAPTVDKPAVQRG
jgi:hypothetical protein